MHCEMENIGDIHLSPAQSCHFKEPESHVRTWLCSQTGILPSQYTNLAVDKVVSSVLIQYHPECVCHLNLSFPIYTANIVDYSYFGCYTMHQHLFTVSN